MKHLCIIIAFVLLLGLCGCASGNSADIPADSVRFRVVTADNQPIIGAEMGCTEPWVNGERAEDYILLGKTDENGCVLWKGGLGETDFDIDIENKTIHSFTRMMTEEDLGTEILITVESAEP